MIYSFILSTLIFLVSQQHYTPDTTIALLQNQVVVHDPAYALNSLRNIIATNDQIFRDCHDIVHQVGHAAYEKYGLTGALSYEDDICGSGYIHGVIEEAIGEAPDPLQVLPTLCQPKDGRCFHGVGHGIMYYNNNDVPKSLSECDTFTQSSDQVQCAEGVFMENFSIDTVNHLSPWLHPTAPLSACVNWKPAYEAACYFYATRYYQKLHPGEFTAEFQWCLNVPSQFVRDCMRGVGSTAMKYNMHEPLQVEAICQQAPADYQLDCAMGMSTYYIVNYASTVKAATDLCPILDPSFQPTCLQAVQNSKQFYQD
jgi:hypothetical protein